MENFIKNLSNCEWAELYYHEKSSKNLEFKHDKLKGISNKQSSGYALRVSKNKKLGFSTSAELNEDLLKAAIELSKYGNDTLINLPPKTNIEENLINNEIESIQLDNFIEQGYKIIDKIKKYNSNLTVSVQFGTFKEKVKIVNSNELNSSYSKNYFGTSFSATLIEQGNFLEWWKAKDKILSENEQEELIEELIKELEIAKNNVSINKGKLPVILSPESLPYILKAFESGIDGENVYKKVSPLSNKLNEKILDHRFTLIDDGTLKDGVATYPFDDEGVITKRKYIFKDGVLLNFLHNLESASNLNQEPTGNGFRMGFLSGRDYAIKPLIEITNLIIEPGELTFEQMIKDIKEGLLIMFSPDCWMGNILNGEIQGSVGLGLKIENGKLVGRVKDISFSFNIYEAFSNQIVGIGNKLYIPNSASNYRLPYIYLKDVNIA